MLQNKDVVVAADNTSSSTAGIHNVLITKFNFSTAQNATSWNLPNMIIDLKQQQTRAPSNSLPPGRDFGTKYKDSSQEKQQAF